jgi:predicted polyphosphate/ATP-dependent NAD kinase
MSDVTVGIIANPAAGKDIRRLVAQGRFVPNHEKVNIVRRILAGMDAVGIDRALIMPDPSNMGWTAAEGAKVGFESKLLDMVIYGAEIDSTTAAGMMADAGATCLVTLGGDGTNRAVAKGARNVPLVAVSTGTNNVFPELVEGTSAGMAAAVVARGLVDPQSASVVSKLLEVTVDGPGTVVDTALVDLAVSRQRFVGSRAVWDPASVREIFLSRAVPGSVGLSAIGAALQSVSSEDDHGLYLRLGPGGTTVIAPIAPGVVSPVEVAEWRTVAVGEDIDTAQEPGTVALDGERTFTLSGDRAARVTLTRNGPRVVGVAEVLRQATLAGVFVKLETSVNEVQP